MGVEIRFYHLTQTGLEVALAQILERARKGGHGRIQVLSPSRDRLERLDLWLWENPRDSFLPHGLAGAGDAAADLAEQPVLLAEAPVAAHPARMVLLLDQAALPEPDGYDLVCLMFDGHDAEAVAAAREAWKQHRAAGRRLIYWQQQQGGGWKQMAASGA